MCDFCLYVTNICNYIWEIVVIQLLYNCCMNTIKVIAYVCGSPWFWSLIKWN